MKKMNGSFTVEASLVVPFITFIIIAFLFVIFFSHDKVLLQTYSLQAADRTLEEKFAARYGSTASEAKNNAISDARASLRKSLIMMKTDGFSPIDDSISFKNMYHSLRSYRSVSISASGHVAVSIVGPARFTGSTLSASKKTETIKTDYADDWFRKRLRDAAKK